MIGTRSCRDVITRLLDKDELKRLGSKSGASEVKQHKWFAKINWGLLRNTQPPVSELLPSWLFPVIFFDVNFTATFAGSCYSKSHACDPNRLSEDCSHCLRVLRTQIVWMTFAVWCMYSLHWISIMGNDFLSFPVRHLEHITMTHNRVGLSAFCSLWLLSPSNGLWRDLWVGASGGNAADLTHVAEPFRYPFHILRSVTSRRNKPSIRSAPKEV